MAALANAARHPLLAGRLRELDARAIITKAEEESARQTRGLGALGGGASVVECAEAALARLGVPNRGNGEGPGVASSSSSAAVSMLGLGARRWTFKCVRVRVFLRLSSM